ncbi:YhcN/YlaJ family sporulation lipoprotein [Halobacillus sp. Marseille-Q1614]|uniref:YhcN/YlaJ family sporulation lipoprotein n=1 Tax=Halobacillus sp. Marseille-Q1614 TaxID=2709134 RepID=UPI0015715D61|nr:YhcN/YlaJ family sporulation lipoprotein [Halobacillus sp. Marseille-Q1614]
MWKIIGFLTIAALSLMACNQDVPEKEETAQEELYQPMEYSEDEGKKKGTQIPTGEDQYFKRSAQEEMKENKYSETTKSHDNPFNNEDAMLITEKVNELKEVTLTQTFTNGEKAFIAVKVNPTDRRDKDIEEKIIKKAETVTDLPIVVYTNINAWNQKKEEDNRRMATEAPEKIKQRISDFFSGNN